MAVALSLHISALAAALLARSAELDDDATGAPAIEISLEPAAPRVMDAPDAPPGPLADEAAAAAPSVAASEPKESNEPKIARTEAEDAEFTRNERPDKPVEDTRAHQATPVLSNEFDRLRSDGAAKIGCRSRGAQAGRSRAWRRRLGPRGEAHVAKGANGASRPQQALSSRSGAALGRGEHRLLPGSAGPCRERQRQALVWRQGVR